MSALKRSRRRQQAEVKAASPPLPAAKRLKTTESSHVPTRNGLGFLVDEDARQSKQLQAKLANGYTHTNSTKLDESHAVLASDMHDAAAGAEVGNSPDKPIGISSDEESSDDEEEEEKEVPDGRLGNGSTKLLQNGHRSNSVSEDEPMDAAPGLSSDKALVKPGIEPVEEDELEEPSFGEMLQARHPDPIDVRATYPDPMADRQALIPVGGDRGLIAPSGTSLTTVLTQALKTNDLDLLESCFQTKDLPSIRSTIQRLPAQHVATLLQRLAERIHKRPGRTGSLLVWVQWSLIAHGGYIASQPEVMKQLKPLSHVIQERAKGLQPLLHLKGKLDMLSAQLDLRRSMQAASRAAHAWDGDDDEEGVVYVEGQDDDWSDSDDAREEDVNIQSGIIPTKSSKPKPHIATPLTDQSDSSDEDMPNGVVQEDSAESSDEEDEDEGLLDLEAEETSDEEEEASEDDADSDLESEDEAELSDDESVDSGVQAPLPTTLNRKR